MPLKILGASASCRPWGNTDLLVRHVLEGARGEGAETRFLRLADLELRPCKGCMACVFKGRDCVIEDRFSEFLEEMRWADGVILGSPTYVLGATGIVKNLHDRMIRFGSAREFVGKVGVAVAAAGVRGWESFALPQISLFFLFLGMPVVDQFVGYAQGPGEIFYDVAACERAREDGGALARGEKEFRGQKGACPVCHFDLVTTRADGSAHCSLCDLTGRWVERAGGLAFEPEPGLQPRWSEETMQHHFREKILPSGPRFKARMREIREKLEAFRAEASE
jgi:multimeric flavodoxin WrbA